MIVIVGAVPERPADMALLLDLAAPGWWRVVHGRSFSLDDIVAAHRLVDGGHKSGNVVVRVR